MLHLWTGAETQKIKSVIGTVIERHKVDHRVAPNPEVFPSVAEGDTVLAFGSKALTTLQAMGVFPKNRKIASLREHPVKFGGATLFVTYDPGLAQIDYARLPEMQWDINLAVRYHNTGTVQPKIGQYRYVESLHELIEDIDRRYEQTGKAVRVSCDIESKGFDEYNPEAWIIAISFTVEAGKSTILYFEKGEAPVPPLPWVEESELSYWEALWVQINWLLTSPKVSTCGANFKFDSRWISWKWKIACTNNKFDTLLVGSLLDENRSNSLKLHVKIMIPSLGGYEDGMDKYDMGALELVPKEELRDYVGGDTDGTYQVANILQKELFKDNALTRFYVKLLQPASKVFEKMERTGILVDVPYYHQLQTEVEAELARLSHELVECLPKKLKYKYIDKIDEYLSEGTNPLKPKLLKEFLFSPKGLNLKPKMWTEGSYDEKGNLKADPVPSTALDHLVMFQDNPDAAKFISFFREYGSAAKTLSTYINGFLKHLRPDNRFHPSYMLFRGAYGEAEDDSGTNTGRTSAKDPAVQCLPRWIKVLTSSGNEDILSIVENYEAGSTCKVLTHDGSWRDVVGVYRNGVQPLLKVTLESGHTVTCTENHPLLTSMGFVRADNLRRGDECYVSSDWKEVRKVGGLEAGNWYGSTECSLPMPMRLRESDGCTGIQSLHGVHQVMRVLEDGIQSSARTHDTHDAEQDLHLLEEHKEAVLRQEAQLVQELRGVGDSSVREMAPVSEFLEGYGRDARGILHRTERDNERLLSRELQVDSTEQTESEQTKYSSIDVQQQDAGTSGLGRRDRAIAISSGLEGKSRVECGSGSCHSKEAEEAGYIKSAIKCIEYAGEEETFDLTIEGSHSFVADGIVVHNTIPKHTIWTKRLRRAFIAPPGKAMLQLDYSQGELRITAVVAQEPTMIKAYKDGMDLHAITAAQLNEYSLAEFMALPEEKRDELRSGGKAGNFGLIYGMMPPGFREYAFTTYGVVMSPEDAVIKRDKFFTLYDRLPAWHTEYKAFAHRWGFVRSPLGRVRHLPLINSRNMEVRSQAERQCINSPVQSCLSDMMQLAMVLIDREYGEYDIQMFLMTHDSLACYVPESDVELWAKRLKLVMDNLPLEKEFGFISPLQFPVDAEYSVPGPDGVLSLAHLKKMKGL